MQPAQVDDITTLFAGLTIDTARLLLDAIELLVAIQFLEPELRLELVRLSLAAHHGLPEPPPIQPRWIAEIMDIPESTIRDTIDLSLVKMKRRARQIDLLD